MIRFALIVSLCLTVAAQAEQTLMGRSVTFGVLAYDDPAQPLFAGIRHDAIVSDEIEFGLVPEGSQNGLDVVPVLIDISATRVEIDFSVAPPGWLHDSAFNGYVLEFLTDCLLFQGAKIDRAVTTLPLTDDQVFWDLGTLYISASGYYHDETSRIAVDFDVADCPMM